MSKTNKVLNAFLEGKSMTGKQIAARYGLANPREAVRKIREWGYNIELTSHADTKGRVTNKYSLA